MRLKKFKVVPSNLKSINKIQMHYLNTLKIALQVVVFLSKGKYKH